MRRGAQAADRMYGKMGGRWRRLTTDVRPVSPAQIAVILAYKDPIAICFEHFQACAVKYLAGHLCQK
ncbi:MAG TPA: hypothetical protein VLH85_07860 [Levilinea sp.]|nr:hypothetical protein [Levilinea sp.]